MRPERSSYQATWIRPDESTSSQGMNWRPAETSFTIAAPLQLTPPFVERLKRTSHAPRASFAGHAAYTFPLFGSAERDGRGPARWPGSSVHGAPPAWMGAD